MKQLADIHDLTLDPSNANKGTERGLGMLEHSLREYGAGRSILVDREGRVIAGNKTLERAVDIGLPVEIVQSDGTKLIVVQRTDLDFEADPRARQLAYADNRTGEEGLEWDIEQLKADLDAGIDLGEWWLRDELKELLGDPRTLDDKSDEIGDMEYKIIVDCTSEDEQLRLLAQFNGEGLSCKALVV